MLLEVATAPDEPGALYLSYMTTLRVTHAALSNLIRLCSAPSSESATPLVHGTPNNLVPGAKRHLDEADAIGRKTMEHGAARGPPPQPRPPDWAVESMRGMAGEAATRLRALCAGPVSPTLRLGCGLVVSKRSKCVGGRSRMARGARRWR